MAESAALLFDEFRNRLHNTALDKGNRRIYRAWRLKDEFERFWNYNARWAFNGVDSDAHRLRNHIGLAFLFLPATSLIRSILALFG